MRAPATRECGGELPVKRGEAPPHVVGFRLRGESLEDPEGGGPGGVSLLGLPYGDVDVAEVRQGLSLPVVVVEFRTDRDVPLARLDRLIEASRLVQHTAEIGPGLALTVLVSEFLEDRDRPFVRGDRLGDTAAAIRATPRLFRAR